MDNRRFVMKSIGIACMIMVMLSAFTDIYSQVNDDFQNITNSPIVVEALVGTRGVGYQMIIQKKIRTIPKIGVFSVTNLVGEWKRGSFDDVMTQGKLTYQFAKGLDVATGFIYVAGQGVLPSAGLIYSYSSPNLLLVANPRFDLNDDGVAETLLLTEYKPKINEKWKLYTRLQGLYALTYKENHHARSYVMLRGGVTYKEFTFGLGANFDWYSPMKLNENNLGGFISVPLF